MFVNRPGKRPSFERWTPGAGQAPSGQQGPAALTDLVCELRRIDLLA